MSDTERGVKAIRSTALRPAVEFVWRISSREDRRSLVVLTAVLTVVGLLDVAGVLALGLASSWLLASSTGQLPTQLPVHLPGLDPAAPGFDLYRAASIVLAVGIALLLGRTAISIVGTRRLVHRSFAINDRFGALMWQRLLLSPRAMNDVKNSNHVAYALNYGATGATATTATSAVLLVADTFLVLVLAVLVLVLSPTAGLIAALVFGVSGVLFARVLAPRSDSTARAVGELNVLVDTVTRDGIHAYKETAVAGSIPWAQERLASVRQRQLHNQERLAFFLLLPRYAAEFVLIVSLAAVGIGIMATSGGAEAAALLVAYAAAASRIMPAVVRIQSSVVQIRVGAGQAELTHDLVEDLQRAENLDQDLQTATALGPSRGVVSVDRVTFAYPDGTWALEDVSIEVGEGDFVALVGPSGSGKTTLANLVLGLLHPDTGSVAVLGMFPGIDLYSSQRVAYVPQDAWVLLGTVRDNVALGRDVPEAAIVEVLSSVGLIDVVDQMPHGLDTQLDEKGGNLSGGQRQRLGIARALVGNPTLIVLDEATSALDARSEEAMAQLVSALKGRCAVMVIAHRLRTVVEADEVFYLEGGRIRARGTFDEVREAVPDFAEQAHLAGVRDR